MIGGISVFPSQLPIQQSAFSRTPITTWKLPFPLTRNLKSAARIFPKHGLKCNCVGSPGGPEPGENDTKRLLDAFFLGKAFAETLNERIESHVGEFLSQVGRLQAEQLKQLQEFQEEVFERAKIDREKAAREAREALEGRVIPEPSDSSASNGGTTKPTASPVSSSSENQNPSVMSTE